MAVNGRYLTHGLALNRETGSRQSKLNSSIYTLTLCICDKPLVAFNSECRHKEGTL